MREKIIERHLVKLVEHAGGMCIKMISPNRRFVFDRLCILPGTILFVEVKSTKGVLSSGQQRELNRLKSLNQNAHVVKSKQDVDDLILMYTKGV